MPCEQQKRQKPARPEWAETFPGSGSDGEAEKLGALSSVLSFGFIAAFEHFGSRGRPGLSG